MVWSHLPRTAEREEDSRTQTSHSYGILSPSPTVKSDRFVRQYPTRNSIPTVSDCLTVIPAVNYR